MPGGGPFPPPMRQYPVPTGLFPSPVPLRPAYREPFPVRAGRAVIGMLAGTLWMALFGLMASSAGTYAWWSIGAALLALPVIVVLLRLGDRGAAAGAAVAVGLGLSVVVILVAVRWLGGDWVLW